MTRYMVSYRLLSGPSGNQTFDTIWEADAYIERQKEHWASFSLLSHTPDGSGVSPMSMLTQDEYENAIRDW